MFRSPNILPPTRDASDVKQKQHPLFNGGKAEEQEKQEEAMISTQIDIKKGTPKKKDASGYSSADIQVLEGIAAIRHHPGMYIGSTSASGLIHLIWEALDNAVDEAVAGYGKHIWVEIDQDGWVSVRDEGRGLPFDPMLYQGEY